MSYAYYDPSFNYDVQARVILQNMVYRILTVHEVHEVVKYIVTTFRSI